MTQVLINLPDALAAKFRALVPTRQRSKYIEHLIVSDLAKNDNELLASALAIEMDAGINDLINDFDFCAGDGVDEQIK